jgi:hypothetical protein
LDVSQIDMIALLDAVWQVLDDMGKDGLSCCALAKADLRVAYEAFHNPQDPMDYTLEAAQKLRSLLR